MSAICVGHNSPGKQPSGCYAEPKYVFHFKLFPSCFGCRTLLWSSHQNARESVPRRVPILRNRKTKCVLFDATTMFTVSRRERPVSWNSSILCLLVSHIDMFELAFQKKFWAILTHTWPTFASAESPQKLDGSSPFVSKPAHMHWSKKGGLDQLFGVNFVLISALAIMKFFVLNHEGWLRSSFQN